MWLVLISSYKRGIYEQFSSKFPASAAYFTLDTGDPFHAGTEHGPHILKIQFDVRLHTFLDGF